MGWEAGDYPRVGNALQLIAERLVEAAGVRSGQNVLDVACGQGNAAIAAARRFTESTGVDYAANLLAQGRGHDLGEAGLAYSARADCRYQPMGAERFSQGGPLGSRPTKDVSGDGHVAVPLAGTAEPACPVGTGSRLAAMPASAGRSRAPSLRSKEET